MLICDKRRPRTRGDTNIRPPQGGRIKTAPPASGPRLGRSLAWGGTPRPPGLRPLARFAHRAPAASSPSRRVPGTGAPVAGWATACGCPCPTPSPWRFSGFGGNSKGGPCGCTAGGFRGRAPVQWKRWATRVRAVGGQGSTRSVVPAVHGPQRCPRRNGPQGAAVEAVWLFLTLRTTYRVRSSGPRTRIKPRGERKNKESERKNKEGWRKNKRLFFR